MDLITLRTALLISLSILLVVLLWQRFRRKVLAADMPVPLHAELIRLEVGYHPARLIVEVHLPEPQLLATALADSTHQQFHQWDDRRMPEGDHLIELLLPDLREGEYYLELATDTQRTVRRFRLLP